MVSINARDLVFLMYRQIEEYDEIFCSSSYAGFMFSFFLPIMQDLQEMGTFKWVQICSLKVRLCDATR